MRKRRPLVTRASLIAAGAVLAVALHAQETAAPSGLGAPTDRNAEDVPLEREVKRISDVFAVAEAYSADPVSTDQAFYQGAIPGLLRRLDPHSVFFDPGQFEQLQQMERSTSKGFGSIVSVLPGRVIVLQALPGTPSAKSGIAPGDEILAVNNIRLDRLEMEQLVQLLGEARQRTAHLYVRRPGSSGLLQFTLTPEEVQSKSVERAFLLAPHMAYIRIGSFESQTGWQLKEAIDSLGGNRLEGLVLDLRNNPGGVVNAALQTCSFFLQPGQKILTVRGRKVPEQDQIVPPGAIPYQFKIAILVNEKTASASEIVAGALQDHDRAIILGVPSFGKGLVQSVFPLAEKTGMALTTALYYTPSGRSIQKPFQSQDFELAQTAAHPNERKEFKTDQGRIVQGGGGIIPDIPILLPFPSRLHAVLETSGIFQAFATDFTRANKVDDTFEVTAGLLDKFEAFAAEHSIQPGVAEWAADRDFISHRLKAEIFNQALGVEKGDQVDVSFDPEVQRAVEALH